MKRTPLVRKTPMKRGLIGWDGKPVWSNLKRTPIAPMSAKTKAKQPARRACCAAVRERCGGRCEFRIEGICTGKMQDTHEVLARSAGGSTTDPTNCRGVCRPCHEWATTHSNAARKLGFVI